MVLLSFAKITRSLRYKPNMNKIYLRGLDGLRGIAAMLVIVGHVELLKKVFNLNNIYDGGGLFFLYLGDLSVTFFFVLSGFLITFLLITEREKKDKISIKNFYLRRILRIWPVYYILFFCGFIILPLISSSTFLLPKAIPNGNYWNSFLFNVVLLPNFSKTSNPVAFQSWSIGVEEQFYILWPLLLSRIHSLKKLSLIMGGIVIGVYLLRSGIYLNNSSILNWPFLNTINKFFAESRFDNMATGGILAILFYMKPNYKLPFILKIFIIIITGLILIKTSTIGFGIDNPLAAIVFASLIFMVINTKAPMFLESSVLKFLGKISYGLYMYHVIGIILAINLIVYLNPLFDGKGFYSNMLLYIMSVSISVFISYLSYNLMEKRILKFKDRLSNKF